MTRTSFYAAKTNWDQDLIIVPGAGSNLIPIQPYSPGIKPSRRTLMGDGSILDQGLYVEWIYSVVESSAQLSTILTPLGLAGSKFARVTIWTRDDLYIYRKYNGIAQRPMSSWENYFAREVVILICNLKFISNTPA